MCLRPVVLTEEWPLDQQHHNKTDDEQSSQNAAHYHYDVAVIDRAHSDVVFVNLSQIRK